LRLWYHHFVAEIAQSPVIGCREDYFMPSVTIEEAQADLPKLIEQLHPGEEIVITRNQQPVARLVGESRSEQPRRQCGTLKGTVLYMAPDFDAPLEDFKEYME
jgi:antitoxin (DNA-binding transcriptional repressor) of toxin-antitoxin stability system